MEANIKMKVALSDRMLNNGDLLLKASKDIGLSTAWLLATLGSKTSYRKVVRKDIIQISIPDTCNTIQDPGAEIPLRISSNLLYGVSLMYKQKVDYFLSDVSLIRTRLQKELFLNSLIGRKYLLKSETDGKGQIGPTNLGQGQVLLREDPFFNVEIDLVQDFEQTLGGMEIDSRVLQIKELDKQLYPGSNNSLFMTTINQSGGPFDLERDVDARTIENFMDQGLKTLDELDEEVLGLDNVDFEFGKDGEIVNILPHKNFNTKNELEQRETRHEQERVSIDGLIDFDQVIEPGEKVVGEITSLHDKNISNDKTFYLANDTDSRLQARGLAIEKEKKRGKRHRKIVVDNVLKISSKELKHFKHNYDHEMYLQNKRIKLDLVLREKPKRLDALLRLEIHDAPFAIKYSCRCIFGRAAVPLENTHIDLKSYSISNFEEHANEDLEIGRRDVERASFLDDLDQLGQLDIEDPRNYDETSDDIFDLSFPEIENSEIRTRSTYRSGSGSGSGSGSSRGSSRSETIQANFLRSPSSLNRNFDYHDGSRKPTLYEEYVENTPGAPYYATQNVNSQTELDPTLIKFFNFVQSRSILLGEHVKSNYQLSNNRYKYLSAVAGSIQEEHEKSYDDEIVYSRILFADLIPSENRSNQQLVSRKLAANSFSSMLQLATRNYLIIESFESDELCRASELFVLAEI